MTHAITRKLLAVPALAALLLGLPGPIQAADLATTPVDSLPKYSTTGIGAGREPVSFIYVGTEAQIIQLFVSHGYSGADPITPSSVLKAYRAARDNQPYPTAPFSPAYINGERQDLSFQIPTATNTIHQRHHTRIWLTTSTTTDGRQIWVGTASLDVSIATSGSTFLPAHHIDPNLPAERQYIVNSLGVTGVQYVQHVPAQNGRNTFGDPYYTDGLAAVIDLGGAPGAVPATSPAPVATPASTPSPLPTARPVASKSAPTADTSDHLSSVKAFFKQAASQFATYWN